MNDSLNSWRDLQDAPAFDALELVLHAILSKKGEDVRVLDLRGISDVADLYVIATGGSETQVESIAKSVLDDLLTAGLKPHHQEGRESAKWILLDYFDLVVHIMNENARVYYRLEDLWNDAGTLDITADYFADPEVASRHPGLQLVRAAAEGLNPGTEDDA